MKISVNQLLKKMNEHIQAATNQNDDTLREHITAIHTLCELILEKDQEEYKAIPSITTNIPTILQPSVNKLQTHDENANGDSIFDF